MSGVMGNAPEVAASDIEAAVYPDLSPQHAAERRYADELAAQVASQALRADIYVTERAPIFGPSAPWHCTPMWRPVLPRKPFPS